MLDLSPVFSALSDPTRRRILELLSKGNLTAGDIADQFPISKPSISHHLNVLKHAQLVRFQRQGQHLVYSIDTAILTEVQHWLDQLDLVRLQRRGRIE
ncbi:MAG TPA: winged helix-turn-helix transcriptional regulator [Firmicutes bacterium]|nr:winged helix-turn-helix transcriptional regulator [Bacillota bacterium]